MKVSRRIYFLVFWIAVVIVVLLALGLFIRISHLHKMARSAEQRNPLMVRVMRAKPDTQEIPLTLPSFLEALNITPLWARVNGYLMNFYVDIGDHVKTDQLLVDIDTPELDAAWQQAEAELASLQAQEEIARITAERWARLYCRNPEAISKEEVDQTAAAYAAAAADAAAGVANVNRLRALMDFKKVYAPFSGIILQRNVDIGTLIQAGNDTTIKPMFLLFNDDWLRAFVDVPQPFFPYIHEGIASQIVVPEFPEKIFFGQIDRISVALDPIARTLRAQVNIDNSEGLLRPGLYAQVRFFFKPYKQTFIIPAAALIIRSGPPYVAIIQEGNKVHLQQVKIGRDFGTALEIIEGLQENDEIVLNPTFRIKEGIEVERE
jgi:RND family efflux transporter MFP subunit